MELFKSRPRVVYTNAVGDKVYPVVVDIKKGIKSTEDIQFVSSDVNTGILSVAFIQGNDNYNVTGADVVCSVMRPDASTLELPCEVVRENIVEVPLGINGTSQDGVYSFDFKVLKGGNKVVGTPIMNYSVSLSIGNDMVVEEDDRLPVLTVLMTQLTELKGEARESINQANTATEASKVATANAIEATANANTVSERVSQETSEAITRVDNKVNEVETRFNALTSSQQQDAEVIDARDGEPSLKARLDRDLYKDGISLSDRIEAIEGLKDSQNMKYETDKGYLVCKETKNGVIDDLKIEGKTLVNLWGNKSSDFTLGNHVSFSNNKITYSSTDTPTRWNNFFAKNLNILKPNTEYTVITNVIKNELTAGTIFVYNPNASTGGGFKETDFIKIQNGKTGIFINKISTRESFSALEDKLTGLRSYFDNTSLQPNISVELQIILIEGDYTQNPPSYFEGLMSVGQDVDKIEVLSCNEGNMVDLSNIVEGYYISKNDAKGQESNSFYCNYLVKITPSMKIALRTTGDKQIGIFRYFDQNKSFISGEEIASNVYLTIPKNARYLGISFYNRLNIKDKLYVGTSSIFNSNRHQSDKKQILFYNENGELEPIQELHEWDSIEKHCDNKWYYHKRSGKVVLNGSETISLNANLTKENTMYFEVKNISNNELVLCDRFMKLSSGSHDEEGILGNKQYSNISIRILKSKLSTQDVEGFKQWLQANNVTVVYQLAEEEVYELAPLHLDSYANETLILCNSGAISPKMEFSITSHINELVKSQGDRISLLEEKMYKALKQVLAGDMYSLAELLYPEDFVSKEEPIDVPTLLI